MPSGIVKPISLRVRWMAGAQKSLAHSIERINRQDPLTAELLVRRLEKAVAVLKFHPGAGAHTGRKDVWRYPIPNTGQVIEYQVIKGELKITRWARQSRRSPS